MPEITDPDLLRALNGGTARVNLTEGPGKVGSAEAKTRESQFTQTPALRNYLQLLGRQEALNSLLKPGRFKARVSAVEQEFPSDWQSGDVSKYQAMLGMRQALLKPSIAITSPNSTSSSKETDAARELELAMTQVPGPDKEPGANRMLTDMLGRTALEKIGFNSFSDRWRANFGSAYAKDRQGRTMQEAFGEFMQSPASDKVRVNVSDVVRKSLEDGGYIQRPKAASVDGYTIKRIK